MRAKAANITSKKRPIEWRSLEPSRLETFSDAVFAFAITLIMLSLEVPKSFTELFELMKGALGFAACFFTLFHLWNRQNIFFRRFGLNDSRTFTLNGTLLFVVLLYVYPLKFLFTLAFSNNSYMLDGKLHDMMTDAQTPYFMSIYGAGFSVISLLFGLMYMNAKRQANELKLTIAEVYETQTEIVINLICMVIGFFAIALAWILPAEDAGNSGFFYFAIPIAYWSWFSYRGKKQRKLASGH